MYGWELGVLLQFRWFLVVSASVSGRAGSTDVRTISGFSCATETGWNSGPADPNSSVTDLEKIFLLPPVGKLLPVVELLPVPVFGGTSALPFM